MAKTGQCKRAQRTAASRRYGRHLTATLIMLFLASANRAGEIKVKVVDQAGSSGVESRIMMSKGERQDQEVEVDSTDGQGDLAFSHTCMPGDRLFAEPVDGSYYRSEKEACRESVGLRVKRRRLPEDELVSRSRSVILVEYADGAAGEYVVEYEGIMNDREVSVSGMSGTFCYTKLTFNLNRDVYRVEPNGAWRRDDAEFSSETLAKDRTKTRLAGSCGKPPEPMYKELEELGQQRLRSKLDKDLQGVLSRLQKMKGVESVKLQ